ncbi:MAG TPA: hypothetical protein VMC04_20685 [Verrucomicrobiae bacterium]|jgi:hypothetical protein|nr:hypothetical protein [Verrucomicrobiae bacterium]
MVRLVAFSVGSIFLGLVAAVGLAVYTSARPLDVELLGALTAESASRATSTSLEPRYRHRVGGTGAAGG